MTKLLWVVAGLMVLLLVSEFLLTTGAPFSGVSFTQDSITCLDPITHQIVSCTPTATPVAKSN